MMTAMPPETSPPSAILLREFPHPYKEDGTPQERVSLPPDAGSHAHLAPMMSYPAFTPIQSLEEF